MYNIGIDLGGTDIKTAVVDKKGIIIAKEQCPTLAGRHYSEIVKDMCETALLALQQAKVSLNEISSVGVGIPGIADDKTGKVIFCTNLSWFDIPLAEEIKKYINKPVFINNDATVAGYAESIAGVSRGTHSSVFITLGTGVGAGIIINGKPWSGFHGIGSELGHVTMDMIDGVQCTCGNKGCLERYCSATAIIRLGKEALKDIEHNPMLHACGGDLNKLNAKIIIDAAKDGDPVALEVFNTYIEYLCKAIMVVTNFLDPEVIVLGGGVSKAGEFLINAINENIHKHLLFKTCDYPRILIAKLSADAGVIGAAMLGI